MYSYSFCEKYFFWDHNRKFLLFTYYMNPLLTSHFLSSSAKRSSAAKGRRMSQSLRFNGAVLNICCKGGAYTINNIRIISIAMPMRRYLFVKTPTLNNDSLVVRQVKPFATCVIIMAGRAMVGAFR